jgi:hypothetical protein
MAFKMRSGNKSSFKNMGSSPAKETGESKINLAGKLPIKNYNSDGLEGGSDGSTIGEGTKYQRLLNENAALQNTQAANAAQDLAEKNAKKIDENSKKIKPTKAEEETAARKSRTESMNSMPWNKDVKAKLADPTKTATSKREQRANYKAAKENARKGDGKITKEERQSINRDRDKVRQETAAAKGTQSLSFNWKNAILGGQGLQAGFDIGSKAEKIQAKMDRQDANRASKKAAGATNAATKSQKKGRKSVIDEDKDGMPDTIQAPKVAVKKQDPKNKTSNSTIGPKNKPGAKNVVKKNKPVVVKKKQNQNEGNDPKNEITIKPNEVSKIHSKTTPPPTEVKKEVKEADANKPVAVKKKALIDKDNDGMSDLIQAPKKAPKGKETVSSKNSDGVTPNVEKEVKKADANKPVVTVKNKSEKGVLEKQLDDNNENKTKNRVKGVLEEEITKEKLIGPKNK